MPATLKQPKMRTKPCPDCKADVPVLMPACQCGYDFTLEPCPGCDRRIDPDAVTCPYCNYNLLLDAYPVEVHSDFVVVKPSFLRLEFFPIGAKVVDPCYHRRVKEATAKTPAIYVYWGPIIELVAINFCEAKIKYPNGDIKTVTPGLEVSEIPRRKM